MIGKKRKKSENEIDEGSDEYENLLITKREHTSKVKEFRENIRKYSFSNQRNLINNSLFLQGDRNSHLIDSISDKKEPKVLIFYCSGSFCLKLMENKEQKILIYEKNFLFKYMSNQLNFCDREFTKDILNPTLDPEGLISTPKTLHGKRIFYRIYEFDKIIDSNNMTLEMWKRIGRTIRNNYEDYDSFIIIHGTDTMVYTASILSFMLENLNKPVILTGAHIPLSEMRNDAHTNLVDALTIAAFYKIPEVCILFGSELFRGNRTIKTDNVHFTAFESPNFQPLAELGVNIKVNWEFVSKESEDNFCYFDDLNSNIGIVKIFPMIDDEQFETFFKPPIEAVIIETYGAGNIPLNRPKLIEIIKEASERGVILLNVSQCRKGVVSTSYETGKLLENLGVIFAGDITLECALAKLSYLLGKKYDRKTLFKMIKTNLRGELTPPFEEHFSYQSNSFINYMMNTLDLTHEDKESKVFFDSLMPSIINELIEQQNLEILKKFENEISHINFAEFTEKSPLHIAAKNGNEKFVKFLLKFKNIKINMLDNKKMTALNHACLHKKENVAIILKDSGGKLNEDPCLNLGHHFSKLAYEGDLNALKLFHECGANLMAKNYQNRTAAHIAAAEGKIEILKFLITEGKYNIFEKDKYGNIPIDDGNQEIKEYLKQYINKH